MSTMTGLHQVALRAPDLDVAVAYYRDVVGLRLLARFDPPGLAFLDLGGGTRLLLEGAAPASMLYLRVEDIDAAFAAWSGADGAEAVSEPHVIHVDADGAFGPAGHEEWMAFVRDPAGNLLGLAQQRPPSP